MFCVINYSTRNMEIIFQELVCIFEDTFLSLRRVLGIPGSYYKQCQQMLDAKYCLPFILLISYLPR